ncbi:uncharacterized protein [Cicer arietinum]|uniref:non-specific serine/threonine protein kinase n=1 Tax=Cicer arietinum TaxID=3827 RepID=A0A3Q7XRI8_CICAR|nr:leucine-rich repeat receptor-like protein kinase TDR isoform X2 [Cicer arietinum]
MLNIVYPDTIVYVRGSFNCPSSFCSLQVPMEIFKLFYFINLLSTIMLTSSLAIDRYSQALLSLKSELIDDDNSLHDWMVPSIGNLTTSSYACSWSGIKCNKDSIVTSIDLSMKKLGGVLSGNQFSFFTNVIHLNLSQNLFSGQLPTQIFNLTSLKTLDISRNNFSGQFPKGVHSLKNLVVLDALSNSFSGTLPAEFSELKYLKVLNLAGSYFRGSIPFEFGSFRSLEFLHLAGNSLTGNIPPELGNLKTVTHMEIGYNFYHGFIPPQLGNMSQLQYLDIASANLSGPIPKELSNLTNLHSIFLFRNQLTGSIPSEFNKIQPLTDLDLSDNFLSGSIPESISELKNLRLLSLMYNDMSGTVSDGIAQLPSLETLLIWNNSFSGSLPESLGKNSKLGWVDVSTNNFNGSIPPNICGGGVLFKLILFSNKFTGSIPKSKSFISMGRSAFVGNSELCGAPLRPCTESVGILGGKSTWKLTYIMLLSVGLLIILLALAFGIHYFKKGFKSQWKMVSFVGLNQFTANDVLTSFSTSTEHTQVPSPVVTKAFLPTGITVLVKKIEWETRSIKLVSEFIMRLGNARHKNLIRVLGFCHNQNLVYLLYDYLQNGNLAEKIGMKWDWEAKLRTVVGIARGLCFLHHDCYPAIPHGDLKSSNIVFDENMEPYLANFGFKHVLQLSKGLSSTTTTHETEYNEELKEELCNDIYNFGKMILEILTGGRFTSVAASIQSKSHEVLLREVCNGNEVSSTSSIQDIKLVLEVAMLCTRSRSSDRPSMDDALKLLSRLKDLEDHKNSK